MFYAVNNYIWLNLNKFPAFAGEAYHLLRSLDYFEILTNPSVHLFSDLLRVDNLRPPFFHLCMAVSNILWGNSKVVSIMTNIFFAGILFSSVYYMGKKMQDKKAGLLAAFIVAMYPFVFGLSRMAKTYFASMALTCLSLCCLIYTDKFKRTLFSILLGVFLGLGALTRIQFVFFVFGPLILMTVSALTDKDSMPKRKKVMLNLVLTAIITILVGGIWYFSRFLFLLETYGYYSYLQKTNPLIFPKLFSFPSVIFYFRSLINGQISLLFILLFFIGLIVILRKGKFEPMLFSWIIVTYAIFTLIKMKEFRITSEYLPAFALITALGILRLKKQWLKRCLVYIIIFGGLTQYFIVSYTNPSSSGIKLSFFDGRLAEGLTVSSYLYPINEVFFHYPRRGDWQIGKIISMIQKESSTHNSDITIGVTDAYIDVKTDWFDPFKLDSWHENFVATNVDALNYFLRTNGLSYNVISLSYWKGDWRRNPLLDFIISVKEIENLAPSVFQQYKLILQTEAPDRSPIYVYKRASLDQKT